MKTKDKILKWFEINKNATGSDLTDLLGISRQAVNKHIKGLIQQGRIVREGATRGAVYRLADLRKQEFSTVKVGKIYTLKGLAEDMVYRELAILLNIDRRLGKSAGRIFHYAFTEILNNSIDHSASEKCGVNIEIDAFELIFKIRDYGIGIFHSIYKKFGLDSETAAIGELIKGKTTTMAQHHSGEGIFFTSKSSDTMQIRSHRILLLFDNRRKDVFVQEKRRIQGTEVIFRISRKTRRKLDAIFEQFAPEEYDYRFEKTRVQVKLFQKEYISRSEAKRLLFGLNRFKEIVLDFSGVKSLGQGFADEVFRVFIGAHPGIVVIPRNVSATLEPVIRHVVDNKI